MYTIIVSLLVSGLAASAAQAPRVTHVVGRVVDARTKAPVPDATVVLQPVGRGASNPARGSVTTRTNDLGAFTLDVPSSRYQINVSAAGFIRSDAANPSLNRSISGSEVNLGDIRLTPAGVLEGRVFDAGGTAMPGIFVSVVPPGLNIRRRNEVGDPVGSSTTTDDRGAFRITGLPAGKYYVAARPIPRLPVNQQAAADVTFVTTYYPGSGSTSAARLVEIVAGESTKVNDFRLVETATVMVSGTVVDKKRGWPVDGAMVSFRPENDRLGRPFSVTAQSDGTFTVAVADGTYRVEVSRPIVVATANSRSVRYERATKSVKIKVDGQPVSGLKVVADR